MASRCLQTSALFRNKLAAPVDLEIDMTVETCSELTATNIGLLQQALSLVRRMEDAKFSASPKGLEPHRVGSHLRHVLEFYDCFLAVDPNFGMSPSTLRFQAARSRSALPEAC